jgi:hypothetical protein
VLSCQSPRLHSCSMQQHDEFLDSRILEKLDNFTIEIREFFEPQMP